MQVNKVVLANKNIIDHKLTGSQTAVGQPEARGGRSRPLPDGRYALKNPSYFRNPRVFLGSFATSLFGMPKLSAMSDAGFPASHFEIEISSNVGLLNSAKNFNGSRPMFST